MPPSFLLTVGGADLSAFDGITEAELKATTYLRANGNETQIYPSRAITQKQLDGRITSVHFEFPTEIEGRPTIAAREKSVEFSCKLKYFKVRTTFNLSKMSTEAGRDL